MQNIYKHNWYNRNTITWTYGAVASVNSNYSNLRYTLSEVKTLLRDYKALATEIGKTLHNFLGLNVAVKVGKGEETSYTDGSRIYIEDFDYAYKDDFDHLDFLFAVSFHEAAHCLYTNWETLKRKNIRLRPLLSRIQNILEDEENEIRLSKKNMSFAKYFAKEKYTVFEKNVSEEAIRGEHINNLDEIMMLFFCIVRYPKYIESFDKEILDKYEDLFIKINNILINCNCPSALPVESCEMFDEDFYNKQNITDTTVHASFEIYKYLQEYFADDFNNEQKEVEEDENSSINTIYTLTDDWSEERDTNWSDDGCYIPHDDVWMGSDKGNDSDKTPDRVRFGNKAKYTKLLDRMRPYMKTVERAVIPNGVKLQDTIETYRFRRNGNLDTNRLAEAMQNINTIYNQRMTIKNPVKNGEPKYAFVMIIDESGSMLTRDRADEFAHATAAMFYEVFSQFSDIEFYVYGHGDVINPYITKEKKDKYVLGNYDKQNEQNDAKAYKWIINDVKRQTNLPIIALSITDFYYCSKDNDMRELFSTFRENGVAFNMLKLSGMSSPRDIRMCERVLHGQVVSIKNVRDMNEILHGLNGLCEIIRTNYKRFCRK